MARLYERLGSRIFHFGVAVAVTFGAITMVVLAAISARFFELSTGQVVSALAIWLPVATAALLLGLIPSRAEIRTRLLWEGPGRNAANAPDVWYSLVRTPRIVGRCTVAIAIVIPPAVWWAIVHFNWPAWFAIPGAVGLYTGLAAASLVTVYVTTLLVRPWLEDVASYLPADFRPATHGMRLRAKSIAALPAVTMVAAMIEGAFANVHTDGATRATIAIALGLGCTAVATAIFFVVNQSLLAPVDHLLQATRRVRAGDLDTPILLVSDDELGEVGDSFNRMLADLRTRTAELQASRERLVAVADAERRRLERDLHDGAQQNLALLGIKLRLAHSLIETDPAAARAVHEELHGDLVRALAELRDLSHGIFPALLESDGLRGALADIVSRAEIPASLDCDGAGRYAPELEAAVYFCCVEALENAAKHAGAGATARVRLGATEDELSFAITDDGCGCDADAAGGAPGLQNMRDRIGAVGGKLLIESAAGRGTTIAGRIPLG